MKDKMVNLSTCKLSWILRIDIDTSEVIKLGNRTDKSFSLGSGPFLFQTFTKELRQDNGSVKKNLLFLCFSIENAKFK